MSTIRVFVGNLPDDVRKSEVEDLFAKYGRMRDIDIKLPKTGPGKYLQRKLAKLDSLAAVYAVLCATGCVFGLPRVAFITVRIICGARKLHVRTWRVHAAASSRGMCLVRIAPVACFALDTVCCSCVQAALHLLSWNMKMSGTLKMLSVAVMVSGLLASDSV
jgi:RNA recognition motif-containing protein